MRDLAKSKLLWVATLIFVALTVIWIYTFVVPAASGGIINVVVNFGLLALYGGICGLVASRHWGGFKSLLGRAIIVLSIGLMAQHFGMTVYSTYIWIFQVDAPYPSIGDIGYFGSVLLYIYGSLLLAKGLGVALTMKQATRKAAILIVPLVLVIGVYTVFLASGYDFSGASPIRVILDFGYPLGQAIYIAVTLSVYLLSRSSLGGIMRSRIILLLAALSAQFLADFVFLLLSEGGLWEGGGPSDYLYLVSYFLMTVALIRMGLVYKQIKEAD